jgi:hypothetical protein
MKDQTDISDESLMTEIFIQPDGRVYVFGTSRPVLEVLESLEPKSDMVQRLLATVKVEASREA